MNDELNMESMQPTPLANVMREDIEGVTLEEWAASGINCTMSRETAETHAAGLAARGWFTSRASPIRS